MHISRSGTLTPYGDSHDVLIKTKADLDRVEREQAYGFWECEGRPEMRSDEYWHRAHEQLLLERAYRIWEREGHPQGQADQHYRWTCDFERM
jgi:Protein of unknown function (DUF2934)